MDSKKWYASKTVWFNVAAAGLLAILEGLGDAGLKAEYVAMGMGVVNLVLRLVTNKAVTA